MPNSRTLAVITWDGVSTPLGEIEPDAAPEFDILLFNYSGNGSTQPAGLPTIARLSQATECKGQIYAAISAWLAAGDADYDYVGLIDDDLTMKVSSINTALALAIANSLDSFAISLSADSFFSHPEMLRRPGVDLHPVDWVEVMMPFYRIALFQAGERFFRRSISSWGIDQYLMPFLQKIMEMDRVAVIDRVEACHRRPITSDCRVYSNGLTARQELRRLRRSCLRDIRENHPELLGTAWFYDTFAPAGCPRSFRRLRLLFPLHLLRRWYARRLAKGGSAR